MGGVPRLIECWFPGSHCDVGGGHAAKEDQLWPLSLEWMLSEAEKTGLLVDPVRKQTVFASASSPTIWETLKHHESLEGRWKLAERFPALRWRKDDETGEWRSRFETGRGTPRKVQPGELIHQSALLRLREKEVLLPDGKMGLYNPPSLCAKYKDRVRHMPDPLPEYRRVSACGMRLRSLREAQGGEDTIRTLKHARMEVAIAREWAHKFETAAVTLSVVLADQPKLKIDLRRPSMCDTIFELESLEPEEEVS